MRRRRAHHKVASLSAIALVSFEKRKQASQPPITKAGEQEKQKNREDTIYQISKTPMGPPYSLIMENEDGRSEDRLPPISPDMYRCPVGVVAASRKAYAERCILSTRAAFYKGYGIADDSTSTEPHADDVHDDSSDDHRTVSLSMELSSTELHPVHPPASVDHDEEGDLLTVEMVQPVVVDTDIQVNASQTDLPSLCLLPDCHSGCSEDDHPHHARRISELPSGPDGPAAHQSYIEQLRAVPFERSYYGELRWCSQ